MEFLFTIYDENRVDKILNRDTYFRAALVHMLANLTPRLIGCTHKT